MDDFMPKKCVKCKDMLVNLEGEGERYEREG